MSGPAAAGLDSERLLQGVKRVKSVRPLNGLRADAGPLNGDGRIVTGRVARDGHGRIRHLAEPSRMVISPWTVGARGRLAVGLLRGRASLTLGQDSRPAHPS